MATDRTWCITMYNTKKTVVQTLVNERQPGLTSTSIFNSRWTDMCILNSAESQPKINRRCRRQLPMKDMSAVSHSEKFRGGETSVENAGNWTMGKCITSSHKNVKQ